jgi:hypothetical protein
MFKTVFQQATDQARTGRRTLISPAQPHAGRDRLSPNFTRPALSRRRPALSQRYVEDVDETRTQLGKERVSARSWLSGWNNAVFNILLRYINAGCSNRFSSKAAGSLTTEAYPLGYVAGRQATENAAGDLFQHHVTTKACGAA